LGILTAGVTSAGQLLVSEQLLLLLLANCLSWLPHLDLDSDQSRSRGFAEHVDSMFIANLNNDILLVSSLLISPTASV
jgi:hypothetical protein